MRERGPAQMVRLGAQAAAKAVERIVHWLLDTTGGRLRVVPRLSSLAMSMVGVLLVGASVTGMAGASAAPPPPGGGAVANPTPPAASGWGALNCSEGSFFSANSTAALPGEVGYQITTYNDETVINTNAYTGGTKNGVVPPNNTFAPQWGILDNGKWLPQPASALSFSVAKITPITATIPTSLTAGTVTGWLLAWDSDQNKTGGDCGISTFTINVPPSTQTLTGHIELCTVGTEVSGGTLSATGPVTVTSTPNPMTSVPVPAGQYTMNATAPSGYQFVACGGPATIGSPPVTANQTVTVPANGGGTAVFFVQPIVGTLQAHIYLCQGGTTTTTTEISGGTMSASGPQSIASQANPINLTAVAPGSYTVNASAPSGYIFTTCASSGHLTIGSPPTTASTPVVVPPNGTGTASFYVVPAAGLFVGHIYLCQSGAQTATEVAGGTIGGTSPSQSLVALANPVGPIPVSPDTYTMTATAPANYVLVACGGISTPSTSGSTATESVTVPSNGTGTAVFYVDPASVPNNPAITLTVQKTNNANGSGTYSQIESATSPGEDVPFQVVVTNTSTVAVKITSLTDQWPGKAPFSPSCAAAVVGVTLQPSQSATCSFTLPAYAPAAGGSVTNTALVTGCQATNTGNCGIGTSTSTVIVPATTPSGSVTLTVTKVNEANGSGAYAQSETALTAGEDVPFKVSVTNTSAVAVTITSLTDAWPGQTPFSPTCVSQIIGTTLAPGQSATCAFTLSAYAPAAGGSKTNTATVTGCQQSLSSNCTTVPGTSTVLSPPVFASAGGLAFTGPPAHLQLMLEIGFSMVSIGSFLLWFTRPRRVRTERS